MTTKEKVLNFLRDVGGSANRRRIHHEVFQKHSTASELDELLRTVLSGLVEIRNKKWTLTVAGWSEANQNAVQKPTETPVEAVPDAFSRFKVIAKEHPDASPQRLLQLAGRNVGDPLTWSEWRESHPEWFLQNPREWYSRDVELDSDGYPLRYPENPLTGKEQGIRPTTERGWFEWATRQPGASLEPLAVEMPAYECGNILRTCKKIGLEAAQEIFSPVKIETAHRLVGLALG